MKTRAITGIIFVVVMLGSLLFGPYLYAFFFLLLSLFSLKEFYGVIGAPDKDFSNRLGILCGAVIFLATFAYFNWYPDSLVFICCIPFLTLIYLDQLYRKGEIPFRQMAYLIFGVVYVVFPYLTFYSLAYLKGGFNYHYPMGFLFLLWSNDTGAYLVGKKMGKHFLFQRHSPKKTWEGFFGGLLLSVLVAAIIAHYFTGIYSWQWISAALIISVFGTYGDLTESMLKRSYQIKDSGSLLPGHGGLLDRFDGLLLAAPLVWLFLKLTVNYG